MSVAYGSRWAAARLALVVALAACVRKPGPRRVAPHLSPKAALTARPTISDAYRLDSLELPGEVPQGTMPTICGPGMVAVPWLGGLALAGWRGWLVEPARKLGPVVACDPASGLVTLQNGVLRRWTSPDKAETLAQVPAGRFQLALAGDTIWIHGQYATGEGGLLRFVPGKPLQSIWKGTKPVDAAAALGSALVTCIGGRVLLWRPGNRPIQLVQLDERCDGAAIDGRGRVYVSTSVGVLRLRGKQAPEVVTTGLHGPLAARTSRIYVLWRARHAVFALSPRR